MSEPVYEYAVYERSNFKTWHKSGGWYNTLDHAELVYKQRVAGRKMSRRSVTGVRLMRRPQKSGGRNTERGNL